MLKLDEEEPPWALAAVRLGQAQAPDMEGHGWPLPHGIMYIPVQGFLDLAGLQTPEAPLIPGALWIHEVPLILGAPSIRAILTIIS
jgi:hypothetical protein